MPTTRSDILRQAPAIEGWVSLVRAGARLGYSKQGMHYAASVGKIETLRRCPAGDHYVMREAELPMVAERLGLVPDAGRPGFWRLPPGNRGTPGDVGSEGLPSPGSSSEAVEAADGSEAQSPEAHDSTAA